MEREKEIARLVNVLRKTARMAMQSEWTGGSQDAAAYCTGQYNRVLARLKELDPGVAAVFDPLPDGSSLSVVAMACRQLAAYFEPENAWGTRDWGQAYGVCFDGTAFRDFWRESAHEIEDLGEFIRESIDEWVRRRAQSGKRRAGRQEAEEAK
jgi:hypothetical protein